VRSLWVAAAIVVVWWASSCGGIAVVDGGGGQGAGQSNGSGSGASQQGPAPVGPGPSSSTGVTGDLCVDGCNLIAGCYLPEGCIDGCRAVVPACTGQRDTYLTCLFDELLTSHPCDLPDKCIVALDKFTACLGLKPVSGTCSDADGTCSCSVTDPEGNSYGTSCDALEFSTCACTLNGVSVGTCTTPGFDQCSPLDDCCATLFFVAGEP
jgi:hypothetical protein